MEIRHLSLKGLCIFMAVFFAVPAWAVRDRWVGKEAPYFRVEAGDGKVMDARMIRGKVTVLFYECKDALAKSRPLKKALNAYYQEQAKEMNGSLVVLPVINATSGAAWPWKGLWKQALSEQSKRVGMTVYADWDGRMCAAFAMDGNDTNLVILDKNGVIRFHQTGAVSPEQADAIRTLLEHIVNEGHGTAKRKQL